MRRRKIMKKKLLALALGLVVVLTTACGAKNSDNKNTENKEGVKVVKIGVSPEPHQKLVELVKEDLEKEGIKLDIVTFTDYIQPNLALDAKELDLNFFQHKPYLDEFNNKKNTKLSVLGNVHVEPMGLYLNNASEIKDGAEIAIPNDPSNGARALILLDKNGIIKLKDNTNILSSVNDIKENPKKIKFTEVEAAQLPRIIKDIDGAVINGNYAIEAGLSPTKDAKLIEGKDSPYANIITVRTGEENNETYKKVLKALQSEKVKDYINKTYNGGIVPAF
ncbi:NLPA lipoprotein [Parvimonas sp. KA00067]|nr:NLPA lipoprotein [Parvimonas sp. KA00067]